jgi:hypothetical protein
MAATQRVSFCPGMDIDLLEHAIAARLFEKTHTKVEAEWTKLAKDLTSRWISGGIYKGHLHGKEVTHVCLRARIKKIAKDFAENDRKSRYKSGTAEQYTQVDALLTQWISLCKGFKDAKLQEKELNEADKNAKKTAGEEIREQAFIALKHGVKRDTGSLNAQDALPESKSARRSSQKENSLEKYAQLVEQDLEMRQEELKIRRTESENLANLLAQNHTMLELLLHKNEKPNNAGQV